MDQVPVNLADLRQLLELPGVGIEQAERIVRFRRVHGPIVDDSELSRVLGWRSLGESMWGRVDYRPAADRPPRRADARRPRF